MSNVNQAIKPALDAIMGITSTLVALREIIANGAIRSAVWHSFAGGFDTPAIFGALKELLCEKYAVNEEGRLPPEVRQHLGGIFTQMLTILREPSADEAPACPREARAAIEEHMRLLQETLKQAHQPVAT